MAPTTRSKTGRLPPKTIRLIETDIQTAPEKKASRKKKTPRRKKAPAKVGKKGGKKGVKKGGK